MKVLFAIGNAQTSKSVADKYFQLNGEKLEYKDVFYFRALLEEVKKDKSYDRIIISEELEPIKAVTIEEIDQKIFSNIDNITDELQDAEITFIGSDRRTKTDPLISRLFNIGVYSLLLGNDRNIGSLCSAIKEPKTKKEAKEYLNLNPAMNPSANVRSSSEEEVPEPQINHILKHYEKLGNDTSKYISSFETIEEQFTKEQLVIIAAAICKFLPSVVAETISSDPRYSAFFMPFLSKKTLKAVNTNLNSQKHVPKRAGILNFLAGKKEKTSENVISEGARIQAEEEQKARLAAEKAEAESKKMREEAEKASKMQMEQLRKEKEARLAKAELELKQKQEAEERAKAEAQRLAKEQEELKQRAIAEQKAKEEVARIAKEQEELKQRAIAEQKAKEEAQRKAKEQEELKQMAIAQQKVKEQASKTSADEIEIEVDISALQTNKVAKEQQNKEQEELRQKEVAEQKAKEEAEKLAKEQEALRQKAIAEQKAKEEAERKAKEQDALRQKAIAEQKAKEEAIRKAKEQEELRQKEVDEQKAREEAQRLAREQEELKKRLEVERASMQSMNTSSAGVTTITTPTSNSSILTPNVGDNELESNFMTALYQLPSDYKKVVAFVGTNKVGTTFIANAIANNTSVKGIRTSLLDMTKSKGLYYLYNKSDQKKIQIANECMKNLNEGINTPITVDKNKNLFVYTSLPGLGENRKNYKHKTVIDTAKKNCNLLIIDCDFTTPIEYFEQASEIYLVQDMDIIKLQETTAFLREFKNRNIDWSKLSVIVNKYVKSSFTPKKIVEVGLAYYNDPQMTYTEEFETIKSYTTVPFTLEDYARYTEDIARDKIVYKNYSLQLKEAIEQICRKIYPASNSVKKKGLFS